MQPVTRETACERVNVLLLLLKLLPRRDHDLL